MNDIVNLNIFQFSLVYLLLLIVLTIMRRCKMNQTKLLLVSSIRMTVQLVLAGFILTYIFQNPHPLFTVVYVISMILFAIHRIIQSEPMLNQKFKWVVGIALGSSGITIIVFFIKIIVRVSVFNPQYIIPISGMIIGNAMTGISLGIRSFYENMCNQQEKIEILLNMGATPQKILLPFVNRAVETALVPTLNSMVGMGIVSLPGMMTGQILSGILPMTAILYQIAIMISICTVVCLAVFGSLYGGYHTLYNDKNQINISFTKK
ncbi:ABC transporter permease [Lachnospiraceae bacterium LCP25S3_G4]